MSSFNDSFKCTQKVHSVWRHWRVITHRSHALNFGHSWCWVRRCGTVPLPLPAPHQHHLLRHKYPQILGLAHTDRHTEEEKRGDALLWIKTHLFLKRKRRSPAHLFLEVRREHRLIIKHVCSCRFCEFRCFKIHTAWLTRKQRSYVGKHSTAMPRTAFLVRSGCDMRHA